MGMIPAAKHVTIRHLMRYFYGQIAHVHYGRPGRRYRAMQIYAVVEAVVAVGMFTGMLGMGAVAARRGNELRRP